MPLILFRAFLCAGNLQPMDESPPVAFAHSSPQVPEGKQGEDRHRTEIYAYVDIHIMRGSFILMYIEYLADQNAVI